MPIRSSTAPPPAVPLALAVARTLRAAQTGFAALDANTSTGLAFIHDTLPIVHVMAICVCLHVRVRHGIIGARASQVNLTKAASGGRSLRG